MNEGIKCDWCKQELPDVRKCYKNYVHVNNPKYKEQPYKYVCGSVTCQKQGKSEGYRYVEAVND